MIGFKEFLILNTIVAVLFLLSFLSARRKPQPPSRLNLRRKSKNGSEIQVKKKPPRSYKTRDQRNLTVLFEDQGQTWEAHEVLGLPAGSSTQKIEEAYRKKLSSSDQGPSLIHKAYETLKKL